MPSLATLLTLFTLFFSLSGLHAGLEQVQVAIDTSGKKATLTLYHFHANENSVSQVNITKNLGDTTKNSKGVAGITIATSAGFSLKGGKITIKPDAEFILKHSGSVALTGRDQFGRHTFLISNSKGTFSLGYAPIMTKSQLSHALGNFAKSNPAKFTTGIILATGNSCGFYTDKGDYHSYYLKELNPAKKALIVK